MNDICDALKCATISLGETSSTYEGTQTEECGGDGGTGFIAFYQVVDDSRQRYGVYAESSAGSIYCGESPK